MPDRIKELRMLIGETFNTTFTDADAAGWAADTAYKLGAVEVDASGVRHEGIVSEVIQGRLAGAPKNILGLKTGSIKVGMYAGRGSADTTAPMMATILQAVIGGLTSPDPKTDLCEADCTTTTIKATAHGNVVGQCVLVGVRGDARGNGEVRRIATVDTNEYTLDMALSAAPNEGDAIVNSHTAYLDATQAQKYMDLLCIGYTAANQWQAIGCNGPFSIEGLGIGEIPRLVFDLMFGDYQRVGAGELDQLEPSQASLGLDAPANKALGGFFVQNYGVTTRATFDGGEFSIDPAVMYEPVEDRNGVNGRGGLRKTGIRPAIEFVTHFSTDMPGLKDDWEAGTAKQLLWQFGCTAQNCFAISVPKFYLDEAPVDNPINNLEGVKIVGHAEEPTVSSPAVELESASISFHWF